MQIENANKAPALSFASLLIACTIASAISVVKILNGHDPMGVLSIFYACISYAFAASIGIGLYAVSWATESIAAKNAAAVAMVMLGVGCLVFSVLAR